MARRTRHDDLDDLIEQIRSVDLTELARRLHEAIELEQRWPSTPDGYASSTPGAEPRSSSPPPIPAGRCRAERGCPFPRPCPVHDTHVSLTAAEAGGIARIAHHDEIAADVATALRNATRAHEALRATAAALARIAKARGGVILPPEPPRCAVLDLIGARAPVRSVVTVTDEDGSKRKVPLGQWAYKFHRREGRLPTIDEARAYVGHRPMPKKAVR